MNAVCLLVAGVLRATLPTAEFTLAWTHSVQKTRWEERYRVAGSDLELVAARVQSSGAGMEPPPQAHLRDGWWSWRPTVPPLPQLLLTLSPFTRDYDLCFRGQCRALHELVTDSRAFDRAPGDAAADVEVVVVRPCSRTTGSTPRSDRSSGWG
ncbi:MAG: DUF1850 domain-containing protein [Rudaea sp.]